MPLMTAVAVCRNALGWIESFFCLLAMVGNDGFEGKIRMNCIGSESGQQTMVVYFPGFASFDDDSDTCPQLFLYQVMMDGAGCQQSAQWGPAHGDAAIGKHDQ